MAKRIKEAPEMVAFSLRLPKELYERVSKLARAEGRSLNNLAARLIEKAI